MKYTFEFELPDDLQLYSLKPAQREGDYWSALIFYKEGALSRVTGKPARHVSGLGRADTLSAAVAAAVADLDLRETQWNTFDAQRRAESAARESAELARARSVTISLADFDFGE
jgi:hypothetical protein